MEQLQEIWDSVLDVLEPALYLSSLPVRRFYRFIRGHADLKRFLADRDTFESQFEGSLKSCGVHMSLITPS